MRQIALIINAGTFASVLKDVPRPFSLDCEVHNHSCVAECQQNTTKMLNKASARCSYLRGLNRCVCCTRWHLITFRVELEMVNKCFHRLLQKSIKIKVEIFYYGFFFLLSKQQFKNFFAHSAVSQKKKKYPVPYKRSVFNSLEVQ